MVSVREKVERLWDYYWELLMNPKKYFNEDEEKNRKIMEKLLRQKAKEIGLDFDKHRDIFIIPRM